MGLEAVVFFLSSLLLIAQVFAWRWSVHIRHALKGGTGAELAAVLAGILGWTLVARVIGMVGLAIYNLTGLTTPVLTASVVGQLIAGAVFLWAFFRIRKLRDQTPFDGPGEAMVEGDAEPAG